MKKIYTLCLVLLCAFSAQLNAQIIGENMIQNFEGTSVVRLDPRTTGVLSKIVNPDRSAGNMSDSVGNYVRNAGVQYDVVVYNLTGPIVGIADYLSGAKKFSMKVWTAAPVGTRIEITCQNNALSSAPYPGGRHSVYNGITTVRNAWETIVFNNPASTLSGVPTNNLDQIVISFNNNSQTGDTYIWDDLKGFAVGGPAAPVRPEFLWSNFSTVNNLTFNRADGGAVTTVANPGTSPMHNSPNVGRYVRSAVQYDVLAYSWGAPLTNVADYRAGTKKFFLDIYSPAVGTTIGFTLQNRVASQGNYPAGRSAEFTGSTTVANAWERVALTYGNQPDPTIQQSAIDELAILVNGNTTTPVTVYFDSLFGPVFTPVSVKNNVPTIEARIFPNPAKDVLKVTLPNNGNVASTITVLGLDGKAVRTLTTEANETSISLEGLKNGIYVCRIETANGIAVQKFSVSK